MVAMLFALLAAAVWPLLASITESKSNSHFQGGVILPMGNSGWRLAQQPKWQWRPITVVEGSATAFYTFNDLTLGLFIQYPDGTASNDEIVGSSSQFVTRGDGVRVVGRAKVEVGVAEGSFLADEVQLRGDDMNLIVWSWYSIGDIKTSNEYFAKLSEAWSKTGFGSPGSYRIVVASPLHNSAPSTRILLQNFLDEHGGQLDQVLVRPFQADQ